LWLGFVHGARMFY